MRNHDDVAYLLPQSYIDSIVKDDVPRWVREGGYGQFGEWINMDEFMEEQAELEHRQQVRDQINLKRFR